MADPCAVWQKRSPAFSDSTLLHPIYVSITELNHNPSSKSIEIACKIFTEDLEAVLAKAYGTRVDFFHPKDSVAAGKLVSDYISKHLVISLDGRKVKPTLIGFEREVDAVWSYFEVSDVPVAPKAVSIVNDLLYDSFKQQINLMHVTVGGKRKSTKVDYPDAVANFTF
ncbi:MAG: hypothetical protein EOO02_10065 [Chitinophagaceae bacterium]|nr:MAG: hypothetical protein EOO02_10065 [Chitinophagaceae bacterium]